VVQAGGGDNSQVRRTPLPEDTPSQSKTPSNTLEFRSQSKLVRDSFQRSPTTLEEVYSKLERGNPRLLHRVALINAHVRNLDEQFAVITKRKSRKRKRLQTGGTVEYGEGASQATAAPSPTVQPAKRLVVVVVVGAAATAERLAIT
jgi:hypothetical protein